MDDRLHTRVNFTVKVSGLAEELQPATLKVWKRYIAVDEGITTHSPSDVLCKSCDGDLSQVTFWDESFQLDFSDKYLFEVESPSGKATATVYSNAIARAEVLTLLLKSGDTEKGTLEIRTTTGLTSELVYIKLKGVNLEDMDSFSKSDPYFTISAPDAQRSFQVLYRSETVMDNLNPSWRGFFLYRNSLERDGVELPVVIKVYDEDPGGDDYIGSCQLRLSEILTQREPFSLYRTDDGTKSGAVRGRLRIQRSSVAPNQTLIDSMRSGLEFSLSVVLDFSDKNKPWTNPSSLHNINAGANSYLSALKYLSWFFRNFDNNGRYAMYGFGAKVGGSDYVNHCFPIGPQGVRAGEESKQPASEESVLGSEGVEAAYLSKLRSLQLSSPCYLHPVMRHLIQPFEGVPVAQPGQPITYHIVVILTQGEFDDFEEFQEQVVRASGLPMSVILVGVGDRGFPQLESADSDRALLQTRRGNIEERDIVQRVIYASYRNDDRAFVHEAFAEIPRQVREFLMANKLV